MSELRWIHVGVFPSRRRVDWEGARIPDEQSRSVFAEVEGPLGHEGGVSYQRFVRRYRHRPPHRAGRFEIDHSVLVNKQVIQDIADSSLRAQQGACAGESTRRLFGTDVPQVVVLTPLFIRPCRPRPICSASRTGIMRIRNPPLRPSRHLPPVCQPAPGTSGQAGREGHRLISPAILETAPP